MNRDLITEADAALHAPTPERSVSGVPELKRVCF
jgi:hypothetical protein